MSEILFEIGTEEIPAGYLLSARQDLDKNFRRLAAEHRLKFAEISTFATPRRLILAVSGLADVQEDLVEELIGPAKSAGFDAEGKPTRAAIGFAASKGAEVADLKLVETAKGEYLMLKREVKGKKTEDLLPDILLELMGKFNFPKSMIWGSNTRHFARPVQWLLALFNQQTICFSYAGLTSGNTTRGHRFHANHQQEVKSADLPAYLALLEEMQVAADFDTRKEMVIKEVEAAVRQQGIKGKAVMDEALVDLVTNLVERPFAVCGTFDEKFLQLPPEVLITSMREHQKYFPVADEHGQLLPAFVAVNNTRVKDIEITRKGHQRVLRARLEDAWFFLEEDRKVRLSELADRLDGIIFQAKLGSMAEKTLRITKLAQTIARLVLPEQVEQCGRAAKLCKADLLTSMVGEFPSLQGIMGGFYAGHNGESEEVASGIREHYRPLRAGAEIPNSKVARVIGLADRIDTLAGFFGTGQIPTGTADPFGLRRIALAVIQLIIQSGFSLSLSSLLDKAVSLYQRDFANAAAGQALEFIKQRFINDLTAKGSNPQAVAAACINFDDPADTLKRIRAFEEIKKEAAFPVLAASCKRIRNISKDNQQQAVNPDLLTEEAEQKLYRSFRQVEENIRPLLDRADYKEALQALLALKEPVDNFFDQVMVMSEDQNIRQNRLNLLTGISQMVLKIGDISKLEEI